MNELYKIRNILTLHYRILKGRFSPVGQQGSPIKIGIKFLFSFQLNNNLEITFETEISAQTVYSENVEQPMKWNTSLPLQVKRTVPSGISPLPYLNKLLFKFNFKCHSSRVT